MPAGTRASSASGGVQFADIDHVGAEFRGDDRPDVVAMLDDLEVREDLGDFLAAVADLGKDILGEALIDEAARLEKFDDLVVVHGTVKTERVSG